MRLRSLSLVVLLSASAGGVLLAQARGGGAEWLTARADAQRSSWIRNDSVLTIDNLRQGGFDQQWKRALSNVPRGSRSLNTGVTANGVTLFVPMTLVTGSSNNIYSLDQDTGHVVWQRHFNAALPTPTAACPGGILGAATRSVSTAIEPASAGRAAGAAGRVGGGYRSVVGEPGEGIPLPAPAARAGGAGAPGAARGGANAPAGAGPGRGTDGGGRGQVVNPNAPTPANPGPPPTFPTAAPGGRASIAAAQANVGGFGRPGGWVYVVASDGVLHTLGLTSGKDVDEPVPFVPANARVSDLVATNEMLYAATSMGCGNAPAAVWGIDITTGRPTAKSWRTNGGNPVGSVVLTSDGRLMVAVGAGRAGANGYASAIVALDPKTLEVKDWYTDPSADWTSEPLIFRQGDKEIVAAATRDGRILLLDTASLGGANHRTPLFASKSLTGRTGFAPGALASWAEAVPQPANAPGPAIAGTRWLLVPVAGAPAAGTPATNGAIRSGAVVALKLTGSNGQFGLEAGWTSHDLVSPATPLIVNGVVFALGSGRVGTPAVVQAYDGRNGQPLWNSGRTLTSHVTGGAFWSASSQVYVGTFDGAVHAFGFTMERK